MALKPPDMAAVRRVLIVKLSAIGDLVHALPVVSALGDAYPHLEISWIVEPMSAPMVTGNPYLNEVIVLPAEWRVNRFSAAAVRHFCALHRDLAERRFDLALDLQGLSKSALVAWASGAPLRYGYDYIREIAPILERRIPRRPESVHIVEQLLDVARFLGAPETEVKFPLHVPDEDERQAVAILAAAGIDAARPFVAVNPTSGGGGYKSWGAERISALLDRMAADGAPPVVLIGSRDDVEVAGEIQRRAATPPASVVAQTNLKQLIAILRRATLHVCGDTGSAHIGAAVGTRVVSLFGRTDPAKLAPYGQQEWVVQHREQCAAMCRRYHETAPLNRPQKCLSLPPACMAAIAVEEVAAAVRRALRE